MSVCNRISFQTIAGVLGNVLEWYDFALFGYFSDVIASVFFPDQSGNNQLVQSFAVFGGAFLMRPIGGLCIGYIGDKYGRRQALTISLFFMAIPTFCMGLLPSYNRIGGISIFLLAICRLLQGFSVGGQLPASLVYTVEQHPQELWGLYGSLVMLAATIGTLLGNLVGALIREVCTDEELHDWGWRIPFLSGIIIAFVAVYLRVYGEEVSPNSNIYSNGAESSENGDETKDGNGASTSNNTTPNGPSISIAEKNPVVFACRPENLCSLFSSALTPTLFGGGFYVTCVWMAIYMNELIPKPLENAFWINSLSLLFGVALFLPVFGHLSDYIDRMRVMLLGAGLFGVFGPLMIYIIAMPNGTAVTSFFAQWFLCVCIAMFGGPMCAWLVESYPPHIRLTSASIGYDLSHACIGGFSPLFATVLVDNVGIYSPGLIYPLYAVMSTAGVFMTRYFPAIRDLDAIHGISNHNNTMTLSIEPEEQQFEGDSGVQLETISSTIEDGGKPLEGKEIT